MEITKDTMKKETYEFLKVLFSLPEVEKVQIRDTFISSIHDEADINKCLEESYHDRYSDVDINVYIRIHPMEHDENIPIYFDSLERIGLKQEDILGIHPLPMKEAIEKEGLRILKTTGMRFDLTFFVTTDKAVPSIGWERTPLSEMEIKNLNFWFCAIHALGKLKRKDYLISSHLTHMLVMEGLVLQMQLRDKEYHTNIHRYGYAESLEYMKILKENTFPFAIEVDDTYNNISKLLYCAIISYDRLAPQLDVTLQTKADKFLLIWSCLNEQLV